VGQLAIGRHLDVARRRLDPAGQFRVQVLRSGLEVERSYLCTTQADAIGWSKGTPTTPGSNYVVLSLGASALAPQRQTAAALSGGTDGAAIADSDFQGALDRIPKTLGPGQIASPGQTTTARYLQLLDHAQQRNRFALLDGADTSSDTTLVTAAQGLYTAPNNGRRYGQLLAPWDVIPGLTATTTRTVPPSARQRRSTRAPTRSATRIRRPPARATARALRARPVSAGMDRHAAATLNNAGVTVSRRRFGNAIVTYGMRTLADQTLDAQWSMAPNVRCVMAFVARATVVGDAHEFDQMDGFGQTLGAYRGELIAAANALFLVGALYGSTPAEAFYVDTGPGLNPPASLAAGIMTANVALRTSPSAEQVVINVVKTPITQTL
jgi:phage tail sheath protein FI